MIKLICERCGKTTNGHKIYFGRFLATDQLITSQCTSNWGTKKINVCYDCWEEFNKWMKDKK